MRNLMTQPNYHSGGAESAGNWPDGWVPCVGGALEHADFADFGFEDAMVAEASDHDLLKHQDFSGGRSPAVASSRVPSACGAPNDLKVDAQSAVVAETH